ncbi:MAG: hypothetical protein K6G53_03430 [Bacteroidales bacterium]|nr:hypothetical protein [Bacteroidales bacterium]
MKKPFLLAVIVCLALFTSCEKQGVPHTGDLTGNIYGIWQLTQKSEAIQTSEGVDKKDYDYTKVHFYLALAEFPIPHAIAKKGSFTDLDLDDVDVDGSTFTFNAEQKKISFKKILWLTDELLTYSMLLSGTFDVLELTDNTFVIQQEEPLIKRTVTYTYTKRQ